MLTNRVRIIGGRWRSRWVKFPDVEGMRPTPDRVRETLFNWLGQDLTGCSCLDLFAGSGALGLEAASRGALEVVLVERDRRIAQALQDSVRALAFDSAAISVVCADAIEFLERDLRMYDVAFVDPPYALWEKARNSAAGVLHKLEPRLKPGARVYLEAACPLQLPSDWQTLKNKRAGAVHYQLARPIAQ